MLSARERRLRNDYISVVRLARASRGSLIVESTRGNPPHEYVLAYQCRGIERLERERPIYRLHHRVHVRLPARYPAPSGAPHVRMMTPLFHPHVYPNSDVCMGGWQTTEFLDDFVLRIGALLQYDRRYLNVLDPANETAVAWAHHNLALLPTDIQMFGAGPAPPEATDDAPQEAVRGDTVFWMEST
ncbi:MAG: hypothetical protein KGJ62_09650 [Armatimonadetes bacterium]|nr:hypothetical protein [Armatimonadota bacterium]MDE2205790.1 hypothetical protein [Armatimonadota bacterium]